MYVLVQYVLQCGLISNIMYPKVMGHLHYRGVANKPAASPATSVDSKVSSAIRTFY